MALHEREQAARTIHRILVTEMDPVSLRPIKIPYRLYRGGTLILYDGRVLYDFIRSTGDTRDPVARQPLCKHEIMRLCRLNKKPTLSEEALSQLIRGETGRRELLSFLEDEFVREARGSNVTVPMILEIFTNIRAISNDEEMNSTLSHLRRNGIEIDVEGNFLPIAIRIRSPDDNEEGSGQPGQRRREVRAFSPHPLAILAVRAAIDRSNSNDSENRTVVAPYNPTPIGPTPEEISSSASRRVSLLSDVLPPVLDLPTHPRHIIDRIRQIREDREPTR
jgi:hypothetical protein